MSLNSDSTRSEWAARSWDRGHPYRRRTWIRRRLPWFLISLGVARKGRDCEAAGGWHRWYNHDGETSACYHCRVMAAGQLWRGAEGEFVRYRSTTPSRPDERE